MDRGPLPHQLSGGRAVLDLVEVRGRAGSHPPRRHDRRAHRHRLFREPRPHPRRAVRLRQRDGSGAHLFAGGREPSGVAALPEPSHRRADARRPCQGPQPPGGVSSNIMSYLCGGDVAFSVGMTTVSTLLSPFMTPLLVSFLASGTHVSIKALPMFVSIIETVIFPVAVGFLLNYLLGKKKAFAEAQKVMPGIAVLGLAFVVGGVVSSQGSKFFTSGVVIFAAVLLHNGLGYLLGYGAGKLVGMNTAKKRTISIEVGMQNAGLATNLATTTAQFASTPESAIICAVSCTWHSISGTLLAGAFALKDKMAAKKAEEAAETKTA